MQFGRINPGVQGTARALACAVAVNSPTTSVALICHRFVWSAAAVGLALFLTGKPGSAQTLTDGRLDGVVRNDQGAAVSTVVVALRERASGVAVKVTVSRGGQFTAAFVPPGDYDLTVEAFGMRPLRLEGVTIRPGVSTRVVAVVTASDDPNAAWEVRPYTGAAGSGTQRFGAEELDRFPHSGRTLASAARLSTISNAAIETEGLPGSLSGVRVDGMPVGFPAASGGAPPTLPLSAFRHLEFINAGADVEWAGGAAPALSSQFVAAGSQFSLRSFGDFVSGAAQTDALSAPVFKGVQAGALVSGPLIRDTSSFVLGFELWRLETPLAFRARADSVAARATTVATDIYQLDDGAYSFDKLAELNAASGFGRLDWNLGGVHTIRLTSAFTALPETQGVPVTLDRIGGQPTIKGQDAFATATLTSRFSERLGQEFRIGWDRTLRDYGVGDAAFDGISTSIVQDAFAFGRDPALRGRFQSSTFRLRETIHLWTAQHHIKLGFTADLPSHEFTYAANRAGAFWFSSTDDFAAGTGYGVAMVGTPGTSFKLPRYGFFAQDEWTPGSNFRLLVGGRLEREDPPTGDITKNEDWFQLTGLRSDSTLQRRTRISPRIEFEWRPDAEGRWAVRGAAGIWDAPMDPALLGELIANDGRITVARGFGSFTQWPDVDASGGRPSLSLAAGAFQGPRSARGVLQLSRLLAPGLELAMSGTFRRTEYLPRRSDLNLQPVPVAQDQHGRDIYGTLEKQGTLLAAASGSNRRFTAFDVVSGLSVDGWSEYVGFDASLQARLSNTLNLHARYTWSSTKDNWFMARDGDGVAALSPFPDSTSTWTEGRSDFDVPHRAMIGAELTLPGLRGTRVAALYRLQSGYPFTPGFRAGVDANGDGSLQNDPAFIDAQSADFNSVACLQGQSGRFAERNSCRAGYASSLDARIVVNLFGERRKAELVIDGLNLIRSGGEEVDHALYLVDAGRALSTDPATGTVTVPLIVNPDFGAPLLRASASRTLRVGLRFVY